MSFTRESAIERAKRDLVKRLNVDADGVTEIGVADRDFPDMSLGAPAKDEMSAQMIASGWEIRLGARGKTYEYRADKHQLRLHNFNGANHVVEQ